MDLSTGTRPTRIDHVGIAVTDLDAAIAWYETAFGLRVVARETAEAQGVHEAMLHLGDADGGGSYVQLVQPTRPDTPVGRFVARRGEGIHHVAYGVDDVDATVRRLHAAGLRLVDQRPRIGSMGSSIAFVHPASAGGALVELVQAPD